MPLHRRYPNKMRTDCKRKPRKRLFFSAHCAGGPRVPCRSGRELEVFVVAHAAGEFLRRIHGQVRILLRGRPVPVDGAKRMRSPELGNAESGLGRAAVGLISVAVLTAAHSAVAQCQYDVTIIAGPECPPIGIPPTRGTAINERGDVAGFYSVCTLGPDQAYLWTAEQGLVPLSIPGASESVATDMSGERIVGYFTDPDTQFGAIAFLRDGADLTVISPLPGDTFSTAFAVNDLGRVVGSMASGGFVWDDGDLTIIGPYGPGAAEPRDVNNAGQVVGWAGDTGPINPTARGFIWQDGEVTLLDAVPGGLTSVARAINERGDVTGFGLVRTEGLDFFTHAFVRIHGQMADLGTLPGFALSFGLDINDWRAVVGYSRVFDGQINVQHAFIWQHGRMTNLNDVIPSAAAATVTRAEAINNQGQIAGRGLALGTAVALLLTPIDPPTGDLDIDCRVGIVDLLMLLANWGPCLSEDCRADLNGDATVDVGDFVVLLSNWGPAG